MTKEQLIDYVNHGREIEFEYNGKQYSITYGSMDQEFFISFCEFYKETSDVKTVEELLNVKREGVSVLEMIESLTEEDYYLY